MPGIRDDCGLPVRGYSDTPRVGEVVRAATDQCRKWSGCSSRGWWHSAGVQTEMRLLPLSATTAVRPSAGKRNIVEGVEVAGTAAEAAEGGLVAPVGAVGARAGPDRNAVVIGIGDQRRQSVRGHGDCMGIVQVVGAAALATEVDLVVPACWDSGVRAGPDRDAVFFCVRDQGGF